MLGVLDGSAWNHGTRGGGHDKVLRDFNAPWTGNIQPEMHAFIHTAENNGDGFFNRLQFDVSTPVKGQLGEAMNKMHVRCVQQRMW